MNNKVPMTDTLKALLNPNLNSEKTLFTKPLTMPERGGKVYSLSPEEINKINLHKNSTCPILSSAIHPSLFLGIWYIFFFKNILLG